jgi:putative transposase
LRETPATKYSFCGAVAIHHDLDKQGHIEKPSVSTINRVLKRNNLVLNAKRSRDDNTPKRYYPNVIARHPGFIHQMDLITPLYISGYGRVVSVNRIDVYSGNANLKQYDSKNTDSILDFLINDWKVYGIPKYLQVDNEAAFKGGLCHPRTFGKMVRFCLNFGVQLIFIPFKEPWRNGNIESFNGRFQDLVWNRFRFHNLEHLRVESNKFKKQHNEYQSYKKEEFGKQYLYSFSTTYLPENFQYDCTTQLPITTGEIHFIRLVRENGKVSILNEDFSVDPKYSFEYVWAVLNTREQQLSFFYKSTKEAPKEMIQNYNYLLKEPVKNRIPIINFIN